MSDGVQSCLLFTIPHLSILTILSHKVYLYDKKLIY